MPNREMIELWNSQATEAWVVAPERYDAMLADLGRLALERADPQPGERVLDVGCGSGHLTRDIARRVGPEGKVVGVDISGPLIGLARMRTGDAEQVSFVHADAQEHPFERAAYDVVLSRFGVMFFDDPVAAFSNLGSATAPGGRLAFVAWQPAVSNEWVMTAIGALVPHVGVPDLPPPGAPGPFAFGEADRVRTVLADSGWTDVRVEGVDTTLVVGGGGTLDDAVRFYVEDAFGGMLLAKAKPAQREAAIAALRETLAPRMTEEGLRLGAAVWVVSGHRPA